MHHHFGEQAVVGVHAEAHIGSVQCQAVEAVAVTAVGRQAVGLRVPPQRKLKGGFLGELAFFVLVEKRLRRAGAFVPVAVLLPLAAHEKALFIDVLPGVVVPVYRAETVLGQLRPGSVQSYGGYLFQGGFFVAENQPVVPFARRTERVERLRGVKLPRLPDKGEVVDARHFGGNGYAFDTQCLRQFSVGEQDAQGRMSGGNAVQFVRAGSRGLVALAQGECEPE